MLYLYKAVEALIASNRANPVHDSTSADASTSIAVNIDADATLSVTPERRLSPSTTNDIHSNTNGTLVKSNSGQGFESATTDTTTTEDDNVTTALLRRHSLPGNGCAIVIANGNSHQPEVEEEEEEEDSETAVLTTSCQKETAVNESQL